MHKHKKKIHDLYVPTEGTKILRNKQDSCCRLVDCIILQKWISVPFGLFFSSNKRSCHLICGHETDSLAFLIEVDSTITSVGGKKRYEPEAKGTPKYPSTVRSAVSRGNSTKTPLTIPFEVTICRNANWCIDTGAIESLTSELNIRIKDTISPIVLVVAMLNCISLSWWYKRINESDTP